MYDQFRWLSNSARNRATRETRNERAKKSLNLIINAAQAVDKKDSYIKLTISLVDETKNQLYIEVSDSGCGMDEETQRKVFDPFFTTKSPMNGTGLGLYICHTMVEKLNGRIELESKPGQGSILKLIMPVEVQQ